MHRQDIPHYETDEVDATLREAWQMVEALDVPEHVQAAAFTQACVMLAAKTVQIMQPQPLGLDLAQRIQQGRP